MKYKKRFVFLACVIGIILYVFVLSNIGLKWLYGDKIWVHRVNSIEKYAEVHQDFKGFEIDVVFDSETGFDVNHPPAESIGLELSDLMVSESTSSKHFWLDIKNLTVSNANAALEELIRICDKLNVSPKNVIVESSQLKSLQTFNKEGFQTSYYLPEGLYKLNLKDLEAQIRVIRKGLQDVDVSYISADYKDLKIIQDHFPLKSKLTWALSGASWSNTIKKRLLSYSILADPNIDVLLISYDSKSGDR